MADYKFGPIGLGTRFLQNFLQKTSDQRDSIPQDEVPLQGANIPAQAVPTQPAPQEDIGLNFLSQQLNPEQAPVQEQEQVSEVPIEEEYDPYSDEANIESARQVLIQHGFKDDPENINRFLRQNLNEDQTRADFSHLKEISNEKEVPSVAEVVKDSIMRVPVMSVLMGLTKPIQLLGEGLERYEAAKTNFITGKLGQLDESLAGKAVTEFPNAKLRLSDSPELGDIFRKMGAPEFLSAVGGFGLDIITDIPVYAGLGALFKTAGKGISKAADAAMSNPAFKEQFLKFRGNEIVRVVENAMKGKTNLEAANSPEFVKSVRATRGMGDASVFDGATLAQDMSRFAEKHPNLLNVMDDALRGSDEALGQIAATDPAMTTIFRQARQVIDESSSRLQKTIEDLYVQDPEQFTRIAEKIVPGRKIGIQELPQVIAQNTGAYVKRNYQLFFDPDYKPSKQIIDDAVEGLIADGSAISVDDAMNKINSLLRDKVINLRRPDGVLNVNSKAIIARRDLPDYIRNLLGEIKDPRFNLIQTTRAINEANTHLNLIKQLKDLGLVSHAPTSINDHLIKGAESIAWGAVEGMYTTKDVGDMLRGISQMSDPLDTAFMNTMRFLKGIKTFVNPKSHGHNMIGNIAWFSMLAGTSPFQKPGRYKQVLDILGDVKKVQQGKLPTTHPNYQLYRQMVEDRVIGTEAAVADQIKWVEDLIKNPYNPVANDTVWSKVKKGAKNAVKFAAEKYSQEDMIPKMATYLEYTQGKKMARPDAVAEMYKWFPNYEEASQLAQYARNTNFGAFFLNPFTTFRTESHRVFLNAMKEPRQRIFTAAYFGTRMAWNSAVLGMMGLGLKDIGEFYMTRPEALTETVLNPLNPEFDLNLEYMEPSNASGLFAPILYMSGATGVNPFDYLLDFTTLSPEFGYSNLLLNAVVPAVTGKGKFNEELSMGDRVKEFIKGVGPTSFTTDLPKIASSESDENEKLRRAMRFFGIDAEKRNPFWVEKQAKRRLEEKILNSEPLDSTLKAIEALGLNPEKTVKSTVKKLTRQGKIQKVRKETTSDKAFKLYELDK